MFQLPKTRNHLHLRPASCRSTNQSLIAQWINRFRSFPASKYLHLSSIPIFSTPVLPTIFLIYIDLFFQKSPSQAPQTTPNPVPQRPRRASRSLASQCCRSCCASARPCCCSACAEVSCESCSCFCASQWSRRAASWATGYGEKWKNGKINGTINEIVGLGKWQIWILGYLRKIKKNLMYLNVMCKTSHNVMWCDIE